MARCPVKDCAWVGKKGGVPIHLAKAHDIHPVRADVEPEVVVLPNPSGERLMEPMVDRWSE